MSVTDDFRSLPNMSCRVLAGFVGRPSFFKESLLTGFCFLGRPLLVMQILEIVKEPLLSTASFDRLLVSWGLEKLLSFPSCEDEALSVTFSL